MIAKEGKKKFKVNPAISCMHNAAADMQVFSYSQYSTEYMNAIGCKWRLMSKQVKYTYASHKDIVFHPLSFVFLFFAPTV